VKNRHLKMVTLRSKLYLPHWVNLKQLLMHCFFLAFASSVSAAMDLAETEKKSESKPSKHQNEEALLPQHRIVAYYGNFESAKMGILGKYAPDKMLAMLHHEVEKWQEADPNTPVIPAIDYIAVVAQRSPGDSGMYRGRMPDSEIQKAIDLANRINGIAILDLQVGLSNVEAEVSRLEKYLALPNVMLALDPEFSMKTHAQPGTRIGTMNPADINFAVKFLTRLVKEYNLPPKILVVHRFTQGMVSDYQDIHPSPEVQIVMDMDGWGSQAKKINTYDRVIHPEPVQYTGFKLFYINDLKPPSTGLLTPAQILKLNPKPMYILYQ